MESQDRKEILLAIEHLSDLNVIRHKAIENKMDSQSNQIEHFEGDIERMQRQVEKLYNLDREQTVNISSIERNIADNKSAIKEVADRPAVELSKTIKRLIVGGVAAIIAAAFVTFWDRVVTAIKGGP